MAFSTLRGRPRKPVTATDSGTPELRLKHALHLTAEPIDLCLEKNLITPGQHSCGLHLRWLYTLRYGAPSLTTRYTDPRLPASPPGTDDPTWRTMREQEYHEAIRLLTSNKRYECVVRLAIFNEPPAFLNLRLLARATQQLAMAEQLSRAHNELCDGLEILRRHWKKPSPPTSAILNCNN